ncbi:DUF2752 domain-containing protein [Abyssalbus ytuae]|uniref:DUF2752 domain-containing protein n=1 Tax=Abyssalbus ytuae TaxID=2926907 RepID=A0A9E6ZNY0_9FLAO|nr:DUF2752 domain-containing protein [Abyssalbus ytuae]UOB18199.1 DUF2752 domain-containing protein [Abyssalbus ytuae]
MYYSDLNDYMIPCVNKKLFGVECPGCGMQRAVGLLFEGNFSGAFKMYPAIYTLIILILFLFFNLFYKFKFDFKIKVALITINIIIIVTSYVIKMNNIIN